MNRAMQSRLQPGMVIDGLVISENIHEGGTGYIYRATPQDGVGPGFPVVVKVPGIGPGEPTIGIESFEIEQIVLPTLTGPHVPRFVGTGDLTRTPYIAMEEIEGESLAKTIARAPLANSADTLLELAHANHVDLVVLGAPGPSSRALAWWRSVASSVTANAPCSVHVVRVPEERRPSPA